jgi:type VI secretion system protein
MVITSIAVQTSPQANDDSPVATDLILVRDPTLTEALLKFSAGDWFRQKVQYLRDHPNSLSVFSWELVPGQTVSQQLPETDPAWAAIIYANFSTPGAHRVRVSQPGAVKVKLGEDEVSYEP